MEKSQQSDHAGLDELQNHIRTDRALIDALKQDAATRTQATESALRELNAAYAELDRALLLEKERVDHLSELIDLSAQTQAEPTSEVVVWLEPPQSVMGKPANEVNTDDQRANGTEGGASTNGATNAGDRSR